VSGVAVELTLLMHNKDTNMQEMTRHEFLVKAGNILKYPLHLVVLGILAYLFVTVFAGITADGWKLTGLVIAVLIALKFIVRFFQHIGSVYMSRAGAEAKANIAGLRSFSDFICIAFVGAMAMRSYFHERFDSVVMLCCIIGYYACTSFKKAKENSLNRN